MNPASISGTGIGVADQFYAVWHDAFSDGQIKTVSIVDQGKTAVLEAVIEGTHDGELTTPSGPVPRTGRRLHARCVLIGTVREGKFSQFRLYFDQLDLLAQLGLIPTPVAA